MSKVMTQEERLDYLIDIFKKESEKYQNINVPDDRVEKENLLRSFMNVRFPKELDEEIITVQNDYLKQYILETGIVHIEDIPIIKDKMSIWQGDITRLEVDAIVNAANSQMLGCFIPMHKCIDNCIHSFAGVQLRDECNKKMQEMKALHGNHYEQPTAEPMLTDAYNLPSRKVIHIVGPIVEGRLNEKHEKELRDCYINILEMCRKNNLKTVAFCCISTGVFCFPGRRAAEIAVETVTSWLKNNGESVDRIIFNVFKEEDKFYYENMLTE